MIYLSIGSSLSDAWGGGRRLMILRALDRLNQLDLDIVDTSAFFECPPYPKRAQPICVRKVAMIKSDLSLDDLLIACQKIEYDLGRTRRGMGEARLIDIDIIDFHRKIMTTEEMTIPHSKLHDQAEFLIPLQDVDPDWVHPKSGKTIDELVKEMPAHQGVERMGNLK